MAIFRPGIVQSAQAYNAYASQAMPYTEQDRVARGNAIYENVAGVIRSIGDVYREVRSDPRPIGGEVPPSYANMQGGFFGGGFNGIPAIAVIAGIGLLAFILIRSK
jgi:hypothetical protein